MNFPFSNRPLSNTTQSSKYHLDQQNLKFALNLSLSPTLSITNYSQRTGQGLCSPTSRLQTQLTRPFSSESMKLFQDESYQYQSKDEVITHDSFNTTQLLLTQSSNTFQNIKTILKPKKANSASKTLKEKKSPLLIYKETLMNNDDIVKSLELDLDFSKQFSLIQMKKQLKQNENKQETCPFGYFSAFRKEKSSSAQGIKRHASQDSISSIVSKSKFMSKPVQIGALQTGNNVKNELQNAIRPNTTTNSNLQVQETSQQINYYIENNQQYQINSPIKTSAKKIKKNTFLVEQLDNQNIASNEVDLKKDQKFQTIKKDQNTIDQRISLNSVFLINPKQNQILANKFFQTNNIKQTRTQSTEQTSRTSRQHKNNKGDQINSSKQPQNSLTKLQLWQSTSPKNMHIQDYKQQRQKDEDNFNFTNRTKKLQPQIKQVNTLTQKTDHENFEENPKLFFENVPDYKFDSNYKTVQNHLQLKSQKLQIQQNTSKKPLIQIHFSKKQVQTQFQKNNENYKLKFCQSAKFVGIQTSKCQTDQQQKNHKYIQKSESLQNNIRLNELQEMIEQDKKEKAEIREKNRKLALLNFSDFSDAKTEEILDNDVKAENIFPNASGWIDKSPVSNMIQMQFPLVKNYVDKLWSYYKEYEEVQDLDENNNQNGPYSILAIQEQNVNIQKLYDQIHKMNAIFSARVEKSQISANKDMIDDFLKINDERLTQQELSIIVTEFSKPQEYISYALIDSIFCKLKFFQSFKPSTRMQLLKLGKLMKKEKGDIIFNQGDFGDQMYVILFGSCNVQVKTINDNGFVMERVVATLYDGQQFGELAMMKTTTKKQTQSTGETNLKEKQLKDIKLKMKKYEIMSQLERNYQRKGIKRTRSQILQECEKIQNKQKDDNQDVENEKDNFNELDEVNQTKKQKVEVLERTRRAATIQLIEDTYLISIAKTDFQEVLMELMQAELDNKIKLLSSIHLFDMFQPFALIPLANLMKVKKYSVNDLVVEQGKMLKYFYIVSKGRFKVLRIEKTERRKKKDVQSKPMDFSLMKYKQSKEEKDEKEIKKSKLQEIDYKPIIEDCESSENEDQDNEQVERLLRDPKLANTEKIFDYQKYQGSNKETIYYKKFVEYDSFSQGDYFGGRVLSGKNSINNQAGYALKTVIADTNECEVYVLEKSQLQYLPQFIKEWLIIGLENTEEYDDIDKKVESQKNKDWEKLKEQIHEETAKQIKMARFVEKQKIW